MTGHAGMLHVYSLAGLLERYSSGVYMRPGTLADDMVYMQRKFPSLIFSHESTLYLLGLTERTPFQHSVTIPSDATLPRSIAKGCTCYYIKPQLHELGLTELRTTMGNVVRGYNVPSGASAICSAARTESILNAIQPH